MAKAARREHGGISKRRGRSRECCAVLSPAFRAPRLLAPASGSPRSCSRAGARVAAFAAVAVHCWTQLKLGDLSRSRHPLGNHPLATHSRERRSGNPVFREATGPQPPSRLELPASLRGPQPAQQSRHVHVSCAINDCGRGGRRRQGAAARPAWSERGVAERSQHGGAAQRRHGTAGQPRWQPAAGGRGGAPFARRPRGARQFGSRGVGPPALLRSLTPPHTALIHLCVRSVPVHSFTCA